MSTPMLTSLSEKLDRRMRHPGVVIVGFRGQAAAFRTGIHGDTGLVGIDSPLARTASQSAVSRKQVARRGA